MRWLLLSGFGEERTPAVDGTMSMMPLAICTIFVLISFNRPNAWSDELLKLPMHPIFHNCEPVLHWRFFVVLTPSLKLAG
jgi:hypothetical protein